MSGALSLAPLLEGLAIAGLQGGLGIAAILLVRRILGARLGGRWVQVLWLVVLVRLFVPASVVAPLLDVPVTNQALVQPAWQVEPAARHEMRAPLTPPSVDRGETTANAAVDAAVGAAHLPWSTCFFYVWCVGAAVIAIRGMVQHRRLVRRVLRDAAPVPAWIHPLIDEARRTLGVTVWPVVLVSPAVSTPTLVGAIRPKIVMPPCVVESTDVNDMRLYLMHELAHIRRFDIWIGWLWFVALVVHWYNPLLWIARRSVRVDRELACDEHVLRHVGAAQSSTYAHALINALAAAATSGPTRPATGLASVAESKRDMERRIVMIRGYRVRRVLMPAVVALALVVMVSFVQVWAVTEQVELPPDPFAGVKSEEVLSEARDAAAEAGDLVRAIQAEMRRVKLRDAEGNVWKDKIDLVGIANVMEQAGKLESADARENALNVLTPFLEEHAGDADYGWRIWQLASALTAGDSAVSRDYLEKAIEEYPRVKYPTPRTHSKFQHLVNEMGMQIWDLEGREAAEQYVVDMWQNDRRFEYFYEWPWQQRYEKEGAGDGALEALRTRMGEKPPLQTVAVTLTEDGISRGGEATTWEALEQELAALDSPEDYLLALKLGTEDIAVSQWREAQERGRQVVANAGLNAIEIEEP